ncbi:MAG: DUF2304 domain-containing protein [Coprobacillus cateniformis]
MDCHQSGNDYYFIFDVIPVYFADYLDLTDFQFFTVACYLFLVGHRFLQTMTLSKQKEQIKHLVQELSILKSHVEEKEEKNEG